MGDLGCSASSGWEKCAYNALHDIIIIIITDHMHCKKRYNTILEFWKLNKGFFFSPFSALNFGGTGARATIMYKRQAYLLSIR